MKKIKVAPSILSADFARLGEEIALLDAAGADYIHIDVMDGDFVPNITIGPQIIQSIRPASKLVFDVHLMINRVDFFVEKFAKAGADIITFHYEAVTHADRTIALIKSFDKKVGISIVPSTNPDSLDFILGEVDLVLVMTVNPGFGGQKFLDSQLKKIEIIRKKIDQSGRKIDLEVDGGVNEQNIAQIIAAGADVVVSGNYIFQDNYRVQIDKLRSACK